MFRFLESICFEAGAYHLLDYHQIRVNRTFQHFYPEKAPLILEEILPDIKSDEKIKVRLMYHEHDHDLDVSNYIPKSITQLRLVASNQLDYSFKYLNRSKLIELLEPGNEHEEVVITKNGYVTDSTYSNLIFKQDGFWYTPSTFLLNGVKRQYLLARKLIIERPIRKQDIKDYSEVSLINAMLDPGDLSLPVDQIIR